MPAQTGSQRKPCTLLRFPFCLEVGDHRLLHQILDLPPGLEGVQPQRLVDSLAHRDIDPPLGQRLCFYDALRCQCLINPLRLARCANGGGTIPEVHKVFFGLCCLNWLRVG